MIIFMKLVIMILVFNWIMPHMIIIVIILNIHLLKITLLMWKQFIVFEFPMILPLLWMRIELLIWRVIKILCLWIMKGMLCEIVILMNPFMMLLKIIMREELVIHHALFMFQFFTFMRASLQSSCLTKKALKKITCWEATQHFYLLFLCVHMIRLL